LSNNKRPTAVERKNKEETADGRETTNKATKETTIQSQGLPEIKSSSFI